LDPKHGPKECGKIEGFPFTLSNKGTKNISICWGMSRQKTNILIFLQFSLACFACCPPHGSSDKVPFNSPQPVWMKKERILHLKKVSLAARRGVNRIKNPGSKLI
jgi:hypothetical protein